MSKHTPVPLRLRQAGRCCYLQAGVQQTTQQWMLHLLHNFSSSLLGIMFCHNGGQSVHI